MDCGPILNTMPTLAKGIEENVEISRTVCPRCENLDLNIYNKQLKGNTTGRDYILLYYEGESKIIHNVATYCVVGYTAGWT
jgi:hypothetical protein